MLNLQRMRISKKKKVELNFQIHNYLPTLIDLEFNLYADQCDDVNFIFYAGSLFILNKSNYNQANIKFKQKHNNMRK